MPNSNVKCPIEFIDVTGQTIKTELDQYQAAHLLQQLQHCLNTDEETDEIWDKPTFVKAVLDSCHKVPRSERLSDTEVLINRIWLHWQHAPLSLKCFKQRLAICIEAKLIHAGCVVLLQTQNMRDLLDSEIIDNNGNIYHFIKVH